MTRKLRSQTGRGLSTAFTGELITLVACIFYLATQSARLLVFGFIIAGLWGFVSATRMWRGQDEFGPDHRRLARRGFYLFLVTSLFFFLSFLSFGTFTSSSTGPGFPGDDQATSPTTPHRFRDLVPPVFLLGIAITTETLSGAYFLWHLVGEKLRPALIGYATAGAAVAITVFVRGVVKVREFQEQGGEAVDNPDFVHPLFDEYLAAVLVLFALGFILTRLIAAWLVRTAKEKVAEAEQEEPSTPAAV